MTEDFEHRGKIADDKARLEAENVRLRKALDEGKAMTVTQRLEHEDPVLDPQNGRIIWARKRRT